MRAGASRIRKRRDAALWLSGSERRQLVVNEWARRRCFGRATSKSLGMANRYQWYIVRGKPNADCVARGKEAALSLRAAGRLELICELIPQFV